MKEECWLDESGIIFWGFVLEEGDVNGWFNNLSGCVSWFGFLGDEFVIESVVNDSVSGRSKLSDDNWVEI